MEGLQIYKELNDQQTQYIMNHTFRLGLGHTDQFQTSPVYVAHISGLPKKIWNDIFKYNYDNIVYDHFTYIPVSFQGNHEYLEEIKRIIDRDGEDGLQTFFIPNTFDNLPPLTFSIHMDSNRQLTLVIKTNEE